MPSVDATAPWRSAERSRSKAVTPRFSSARSTYCKAPSGVAAVEALAQRGAGQPEQQRPLSEPVLEYRKAADQPGPTRTGDEQRHRLLAGHFVDRDALAFGGHPRLARGDEPRATRSATQEGLQVRDLPSVVDDQAALVLQLLGECLCRIFDADEAGRS